MISDIVIFEASVAVKVQQLPMKVLCLKGLDLKFGFDKSYVNGEIYISKL